MYQTRRAIPNRQGTHQASSTAFIYVGLFFSMLVFIAFTSAVYFDAERLARLCPKPPGRASQ